MISRPHKTLFLTFHRKESLETFFVVMVQDEATLKDFFVIGVQSCASLADSDVVA